MNLILIFARALILALGLVVTASVTAACNSSAPAAGSGRIQVVAAENFWGSIARQLGGNRAQVTSLVTNPATDPHDYEPTPADARALVSSQLAIVNGIGYDNWASKILNANPAGGRTVLDVGDLVGVAAGGNPHRWYSPADVQQVIERISADYACIEPSHAAEFAALRRRFEVRVLAGYHAAVDIIRHRYAGAAVGASESIFAPMASALGLRLVTPPGFLRAISEGSEPTPQDTAAAQRQIDDHQVTVWVFNSQNSTPDVTRLTDLARARHIPVVT